MTVSDAADGTLVIVATGAEARTFAWQGDQLRPSARWAPGDLADQGPSGKTPPDMSWSDLNEATFSKIIAEKLYALAHADAFEKLILIADPVTLGEIRPLLHQEVSRRIILELNKTLINSPVEDIEKSIKTALADATGAG